MKQLKQQRYLGVELEQGEPDDGLEHEEPDDGTQALEDPSNDETTEAAEIPGVELEQGEPDDGLEHEEPDDGTQALEDPSNDETTEAAERLWFIVFWTSTKTAVEFNSRPSFFDQRTSFTLVITIVYT
ncbi:unnamed protein product [Ambrosiozyma monospora]|uniref:Unnamed protein product n=1 Tax=Ambrosiozyma monospora TaxID=43982 RepID=A0A9W6TC78_AMBMO|nr:unnamed protein product [Ambrosiozyma monospora]